MKIGPINEKVVIESQIRESSQKEQVAVEEKKIQKDKVEISTEGRKKLSQLADKHLTDVNKNSDEINRESARVAKARNRIETGFYEMDNVKDIILDKLTDEILK